MVETYWERVRREREERSKNASQIIHTEDKFECPKCKKKFRLKMTLDNHQCQGDN